MPAVTSLSEFNRNQGTVIARLSETGEPLYLTRNGKSAVVVMDADAFDQAMSYRKEARSRETDVYQSLMRGYQDVFEGRTVEAKAAFDKVRARRGW